TSIVGAENRSALDVGAHFGTDAARTCVLTQNDRASIATTFTHPKDGRLADWATTQVHLLVGVPIRFLAAQVGLIGLNDARQRTRIHAALAASLTDALEHEPCGLLGNAEFLADLHAADTFPGGTNQVH